MKAAETKVDTIDAYIAGFPSDVQKLLKKVRATIRKAAPKATEAIKYRIPTYEQDGHLIFFAAFKTHIGVYPRAKRPASLLKKVAKYEVSKGTYRFELDQPIPFALIGEITKARVKENAALAKTKSRR